MDPYYGPPILWDPNLDPGASNVVAFLRVCVGSLVRISGIEPRGASLLGPPTCRTSRIGCCSLRMRGSGTVSAELCRRSGGRNA